MLNGREYRTERPPASIGTMHQPPFMGPGAMIAPPEEPEPEESRTEEADAPVSGSRAAHRRKERERRKRKASRKSKRG